MTLDHSLGRVVLLEVENPDDFVVGSGGQGFRVVTEVDRLDDVIVAQSEVFLTRGRVPDLETNKNSKYQLLRIDIKGFFRTDGRRPLSSACQLDVGFKRRAYKNVLQF